MVFLEVIFALTFIYFLGSVIVSGINEAISMLFNKRGLELKRAIILLLNGKDSDWGNQFFEHPRVQELKELPSDFSIRAWPQRLLNFIIRRRVKVKFNPSYISASKFADVMIDFIGNGQTNAVNQQMPSELGNDEVEFIGQMRRFVESSDPYNYKQFVVLYLAGTQPAFPIIDQLKAIQNNASTEYHAYRAAILNSIDQYITDHATMDTRTHTISHLKNKIVQLQDHPNFGAFQQFLASSNTLGEFKEKLEKWYDEYMDRVSGWYKRRMHITVLYIAVLVTVLGNIDSIEILQNLIVNQNFRETVVGAAEQYLEDHPGGFAQDTTLSFEAKIDSIKHHISLTRDLFLPVGIEKVHGFPSLSKIAGWILTIFALSLGAPFWFDMMNKIGNLRASGKKPAAET